MNSELNMKSLIGKILVWVAFFDMLFIMTLAQPNEIVPLALIGAFTASLGLVLIIYGEMK